MIVTVTPNPALDRTLTVPEIAFGDVLRATSSHLDWSGKGINVSRALKALGCESLAMGWAGGAAGEALHRGLAELGIATDLTPITGETRTNTVFREADTERYVKVNEPGPVISPEEQTALVVQVRRRVRPGDYWVLSGSLPPGVPADFDALLIRQLQAGGARVCLDTSGEALRLGVQAVPYLVKPNLLEAQEASGIAIHTDRDLHAAVEFFLRQGVTCVALSLGADGLLLATGNQKVRIKPPAVQARNPVGAGDALLAGVVWALQRSESWPAVARWGVACGTTAAMRADIGYGTLEEVSSLFNRI